MLVLVHSGYLSRLGLRESPQLHSYLARTCNRVVGRHLNLLVPIWQVNKQSVKAPVPLVFVQGHLGSFSTLNSKWLATRKRLTIEQNGLKTGTRLSIRTYRG